MINYNPMKHFYFLAFVASLVIISCDNEIATDVTTDDSNERPAEKTEIVLPSAQSVVVVPDYSIGTVLLANKTDNEIRFEVYPLELAEAIAAIGVSSLSLDGVETKSSEEFINIPLTGVSFTGKTLVVLADGTKLDNQIKMRMKNINARLKIAYDEALFCSEYFPIYFDFNDAVQTGDGKIELMQTPPYSDKYLLASFTGCHYLDAPYDKVTCGFTASTSPDLSKELAVSTVQPDNNCFTGDCRVPANEDIYYRAWARYEGQLFVGEVKKIAAFDVVATAYNLDASNINWNSATLSALFHPEEMYGFPLYVSFVWGTTDKGQQSGWDYGWFSGKVSEDAIIQHDIVGLEPNTEYYYNIVFDYGSISIWGECKSFKTKALDILTTASLDVDGVGATFMGYTPAISTTEAEHNNIQFFFRYAEGELTKEQLLSSNSYSDIPATLEEDGSFSAKTISLLPETQYSFIAGMQIEQEYSWQDKKYYWGDKVKSFTTTDWVDLGLSVKWCVKNLGADNPGELGGLYAWGEVDPWTSAMPEPSWATYKWCNGTEKSLTKYCPSNHSECWGGSGAPDGKTQLEPNDDAAYVSTNGRWRMPTWEECLELVVPNNNVSVKASSHKGQYGCSITSLVPGFEGKSIFVPFYSQESAPYGTNIISTSSICYGYPYCCQSLFSWYYQNNEPGFYIVGFTSDNYSTYPNGQERYHVYPIRPVLND